MPFKYTIESIRSIFDDIKKWSKIFKYGSLIFTTLYFVYAIFAIDTNKIPNIILASIFALYTIFELATIKTDWKTTRKVAKRTYKWMTIGIKAFTLGSAIYGIYETSANISGISIILTTLMIILWVLQVLLEVIVEVVENKIELLSIAFEQDKEDLKRTVTAPIEGVKNAIKKMRGEEVDETETEKHPKIKKLDKKIAKRKDLKREAKQLKKQEKEQIKERQKAEKEQAKQLKKQQKETIKQGEKNAS